MSYDPKVPARLNMALQWKGWSAAMLAERINVTPESVYQVLRGQRPGTKSIDGKPSLIERAADVLGVPVEWLRVGDERAPPWIPARPRIAAPGQGVAVYGVVAKASPLEDDTVGAPLDTQDERIVQMPGSWKLVEVQGMSAYPLLYPGQMGIFDTDRAAAPPFDDKQLMDLHDNVVLVELHTGRAYLKRFCHAERAPHRYVLASIDAGRSSPYVPPEDISVVIPMVGTLYQDPSRPRIKRWHAKTVVVTTPEPG